MELPSFRPMQLLLLLLPCSVPQLADARIGMSATDLGKDTFDSFLQKNERVIIDFFDPQDKEWHEDNLELESAIRDARTAGSRVAIGKVSVQREAALAKKYVPNGPYPQILWFQKGEPTQYHRQLRKSKNILDFVLALDRDPIQPFQSEAEVRNSVNRAVWAQLPKASPMYKVLEIVAAKHMDTVEFAFKEGSGMDIRWLEEGKESSKDHIYEGTADAREFEHWVRRQLIVSEPLPDAQEGDSVQVVGHTFEEVVLQKDKNVFLFIYAPWCGYSRKFFPVWETMARRMARVPHLVAAKMDGDRNGSPYPEDFSWNSYPTVFFVKAGERKPTVFHGNRTVSRLLDFAREHGSKDLAKEIDEAETGQPVVEEVIGEL